MLSIFRTNQAIVSIFLLVYALILRSAYFFNAFPVDMANDGVLSIWMKNWFGNSYLVAGIITLLVVFLQAVLLNNLVNKYRLFREVTLIPGLCYILIVSAVQDFLPLSSILLGNTFLILAIHNLLSIFKSKKCADGIFNTGLWIGTAALFYNAFVLFLLLGMIGLLVLRTFKIKELVMLLSGYFLPFIFSSAYFFLDDQFADYWQTHFFTQFGLLDFRWSSSWNNYSKLIVLMLLFAAGLFNRYTFEKSYQTRNFINIFYVALIISGLTFLIQANIQISHFLIIATPLSVLLAASFLGMSKVAAELIHLLFFMCILLFQFGVITIG
ncbi:MAG: hypothetical protein AAGJ18_29145 [Bacteroidota bacterium]